MRGFWIWTFTMMDVILHMCHVGGNARNQASVTQYEKEDCSLETTHASPEAAGLQPERIGESLVFVTPNPSGANPAANPALLLPWYIELKQLRDGLPPR